MEPIITKLRVGEGVYGLNLIEKKWKKIWPNMTKNSQLKLGFQFGNFRILGLNWALS